MNLSILRIVAVAASMLAASHAADPVTLLPGNAAGKFFVPADNGLGTNWIAAGFNDAGWSNVVSGVGFDQPKAPILAAGQIADSVTQFSGIQGASNWFYGYWDKGSDLDGVFQPFEFIAFPRQAGNNTLGAGNYWDGAKWDWFSGNPPWDEISATGGRPNGVTGSVHYVIRRWVSTLNGPVHLVGNFSNGGACGDGVDLRIWVDGVEVLGLPDIFGTNVPFAANVEVLIGSTVDFAVGPNVANDSCDAFSFNVKILQNTLADSAEDFSGVQGARGWSYGYYNRSTDGDATYNPGADFNKTDPNLIFNGAWSLGPGDPPWTRIGAVDMHPNSAPEHWPIRRYTSAYAGLVRIAGALAIFEGCGGGTRARIYVDGTEVFSRGLSQVSMGYSVLSQVSAGSTIDFALDPNGDDSCDSTTWTAVIQPAAVSTMLAADVAVEFSGALGQSNRWVSKVTGAITVDWHFAKPLPGGDGATLKVFLNGVQMDSASVAGDDLTGVSRVLTLLVRRGDQVEFVRTPVGPSGEAVDSAAAWRFEAHIYSHAYDPEGICTQVADSQIDWNATGQQGYRGWSYGYYNKTGDVIPGYAAEDFTPFPRDGGGCPHRA